MTIKIENIDYDANGTVHKGCLAYREDASAAPGVMVIHEWWGLNDYIRGRATQLAELGYAAFCPDMFGDGRTAASPDEAGALMHSVLDDMESGTSRLKAAFETMKSHPAVDADHTAAIGYCFGGAMALHMARIGLPLNAVVSFHGALGSFHKPAPGEIKARILVCHGADDAMASADDIEAFHTEMKAAGADYEFITYEGARHGFTNPAADEKAQKYGLPLGYSAQADKESFEAMITLFDQTMA